MTSSVRFIGGQQAAKPVLTRVSRRSKTVGAKGFGRTGRKPAPVLVPDRLTVKMTVKICEAAVSALRINSLEGSLMIEWE